jgi:hypothetical protein
MCDCTDRAVCRLGVSYENECCFLYLCHGERAPEDLYQHHCSRVRGSRDPGDEAQLYCNCVVYLSQRHLLIRRKCAQYQAGWTRRAVLSMTWSDKRPCNEDRKGESNKYDRGQLQLQKSHRVCCASNSLQHQGCMLVVRRTAGFAAEFLTITALLNEDPSMT